MVKINDNYEKLPGSYLFSDIAKKVSAYQEANPDQKIIRLGIGDVTQPLTDSVISALHSAVDEMGQAKTFHGYAPDLGYEFLRTAIAKHDYEERGCDIAADEIFVSDGAKSDSANIQEIFSLDNVIAVCDPVYPVYVDANVMAGRAGDYDEERGLFDRIVYMPCDAEHGFAPQLPEQEADLIYLCFPNNPTGSIMTKEDLEPIARICVEKDIFVISDEIYGALTYQSDHCSIASLPGMWERTVVINGFSKAYAMTGWRLGYACAPALILQQMLKIHQFAIMCAPTTSQYAAIEALRNGDDDVETMRESYNQRRRFLVYTFRKMGLHCFEPFGAFYVFPSIKGLGMTSDQFARELLADEKVAVVPGTAFGESGEGFLRVSYAYSLDELKLATDRIARCVNKVKGERAAGLR